MSYVADTHAMLWHLFPGPRRPGSTAQLVIPAVVLAEMLAVVERGRLAGATVPALLAIPHAVRPQLPFFVAAPPHHYGEPPPYDHPRQL